MRIPGETTEQRTQRRLSEAEKKAFALQNEVWSLGQSNEALQARITHLEAENRSLLRERNTYRNEVGRTHERLAQLPLEYVYEGEQDCA